jgi:hypothetical protein
MNWPRLVELALTLLCFAVPSAQAQSAEVPGADTYGLARDAYLCLSDREHGHDHASGPNVPDANTILFRAPVNQFAHARAYPNADQKDVVRPNFDTLYSLAWIDVSREPIVLSVPDTNGRYYLLQMLDMWTDVFSVVGSRTFGTRAGYCTRCARLAQDAAAGSKRSSRPRRRSGSSGVRRPTVQPTTPTCTTCRVVTGWRGLQAQDYTPAQNFAIDAAIDGKTPPAVQVNRLNGIAMLSRLSVLMSKYPPHVNDNPILFRLRALGLEPGKAFDSLELKPANHRNDQHRGKRRAGRYATRPARYRKNCQRLECAHRKCRHLRHVVSAACAHCLRRPGRQSA